MGSFLRESQQSLLYKVVGMCFVANQRSGQSFEPPRVLEKTLVDSAYSHSASTPVLQRPEPRRPRPHPSLARQTKESQNASFSLKTGATWKLQVGWNRDSPIVAETKTSHWKWSAARGFCAATAQREGRGNRPLESTASMNSAKSATNTPALTYAMPTVKSGTSDGPSFCTQKVESKVIDATLFP